VKKKLYMSFFYPVLDFYGKLLICSRIIDFSVISWYNKKIVTIQVDRLKVEV
jgi:hypothetical protein